MLAFVRRWVVLVVGLAALIVGIVLLNQSTASFGWFAYAPLSQATFVGMSPYVSPGLLLTAAGLVLIAGWVGFRMGRRR